MSRHTGSTRGFARTSSLLQKRIRQASEGRGFAVTRLLTHGDEVVGEDIARIARPVDVKYGRQGLGATLTILTTGAQATILEMQKEKLREKVNAVYGYNAIARLRITQTAPVGFAEGQAVFRPAPTPRAAPPDPQVMQAAAQAAGDVHDNSLRDALEVLARNVLSKARQTKGDH